MMNFRPGIAVVAIAIAAATIGSTVQAEPVVAQNVVKVRYSDLNLGTGAGRAELDRRIEVAAHQMCGVGQSLAENMQVRRCQNDAFQSVKASIDRLILDATGATASR